MNKRARSVTRQRKYFAVAASPFNAVKLALGVIIVVGGLLVLVSGKLAASPLTQLFVVGTYGVIAALGLIAKTQQVVRAQAVTSDEKSSINNQLEK